MGIMIKSRDNGRPFRIILPGVLLLLICLILLPLLILVLFFVIIGLLIWNLVPGQQKMARAYTRIVCNVPKIFLAMRGLLIDVETEDTIIKIKF
jgi:hypothetical protein